MFLVTSVTGTGSRWPATRFRRRGKRSAARGYNRRSCTAPTTCVGTRGNPRGFSRVILPLDSSQVLGDWAGASRKTSALVSWGSTALICFGSRAARMAILSFQTLLALLRPHYPLRCEARQFKESATCPNGYSGWWPEVSANRGSLVSDVTMALRHELCGEIPSAPSAPKIRIDLPAWLVSEEPSQGSCDVRIASQ